MTANGYGRRMNMDSSPKPMPHSGANASPDETHGQDVVEERQPLAEQAQPRDGKTP
jgi:hypothetical protein